MPCPDTGFPVVDHVKPAMNLVVNPSVAMIEIKAEPLTLPPTAGQFNRSFPDDRKGCCLRVTTCIVFEEDLDLADGTLGYSAYGFGKGTYIVYSSSGNRIGCRDQVVMVRGSDNLGFRVVRSIIR